MNAVMTLPRPHFADHGTGRFGMFHQLLSHSSLSFVLGQALGMPTFPGQG